MPATRQIVARDAFTVWLGGSLPPKKMKAAEAESALFGWVYKQPGMATFEDCQQMYRRIYEERGQYDAEGLLHRFGVTHIKSLPLMLFEQFFKYASTALYYGASPLYGWEEKKDVVMPEFERDRWLFWDEKREKLFEVKTVCPPELDKVAEGKLVDVSGIPEFEQRWVERKGKK